MERALTDCSTDSWSHLQTGPKRKPVAAEKALNTCRNVPVVYITERTTHTLHKLKRAERKKTAFHPVEQPRGKSLWLFQTVEKFSLPQPVHLNKTSFPLFYICLLIQLSNLHPSIHPSQPAVSTPPPLFPCLPQPSTMAIMTHLTVKLLPVETARPWHWTQCLSASLLKSLKSQVDIILTALGLHHLLTFLLTESWVKASKQRAPAGWLRRTVHEAALCRRSTSWMWIYFRIWWRAPNAGFACILVRFVPVILGVSIPPTFRQTH